MRLLVGRSAGAGKVHSRVAAQYGGKEGASEVPSPADIESFLVLSDAHAVAEKVLARVGAGPFKALLALR